MHYRARSLLAGNHYLTFASLYALFCSEFSAKGDLPGNSSALINQLIICDQPIKLSTEVNSVFLCFCVALVYVHPGVEISIPLHILTRKNFNWSYVNSLFSFIFLVAVFLLFTHWICFMLKQGQYGETLPSSPTVTHYLI